MIRQGIRGRLWTFTSRINVTPSPTDPFMRVIPFWNICTRYPAYQAKDLEETLMPEGPRFPTEFERTLALIFAV